MVAIDWGKRIVEIIGSLGNLVWASLLQNRGRIHHSGDGVEAVCEGGGRGSLSGARVCLVSLVRRTKQTRQTSETR